MITVTFIFLYGLIFFTVFWDNSFNVNYFKEFWKNSFDFKGITKRNVFWITQTWLLLHSVLLGIFGICLFTDNYFIFSNPYYSNDTNLERYIFIPIFAFSIVSLIPSISIQVRRLRDAARKPWWILISFIPFIGVIVLLIFYLSPSRKKRLPMTLQDRLSEVENLLKKGTIDEEEYKYMRKKILTKYVD